MEPLYSVLLCNQQYSEYKERISKWLAKGIKVIWFGQDENVVDELKTTFKKYAKVFLLQAFVIEFTDQACILDGENATDFVISKLKTGCPLFNSAQYLVEHCKADEHIEVQASAGTGKTTVMIDRILYLMHTQPDLHLPEIYMVTFTNDATNQMNKRLQDALVTRYDLTRDEKYLRWLEEQSQMNISTIHSFAYQMLREYGIGESFTKNLSIRSFQYEKKEIIKDMVDGKIDDSKSIRGQLGVPFYRANGILNQFWGRFLQLGVSHEDMLKMDWGEPVDDESKSFHKVITETIPKLDDKYFAVKRKNDGVGLDDIMRDLQEVLTSEYLPKPDISMKYLFIDEFQDSDLSQIKVACYFVKLLGAVLFVVGDVKQSIYRFRGANDQSFEILHQYMSEMKIKKPVVFELVNNYRTSAEVLDKMDRYFKIWGKEGYLQYEKSVIPFNHRSGICQMQYFIDDNWTSDQSKFNQSIILSEFIRNKINGSKEEKEINWLTGCMRNLDALRSAITLVEEAEIKPDDLNTSDDRNLALLVEAWKYLVDRDPSFKIHSERMESLSSKERWEDIFFSAFKENGLSKSEAIVFHGFYYITPIQEQIMKMLEKAGFQLIYLIPFDKRYPFVYEIWNNTYAEENGYEPKNSWQLEESDAEDVYGDLFEGKEKVAIKNKLEIKEYGSVMEFVDDVKRIKDEDFTLYASNQREANEMLNVSPQAVSKWEREICEPDKQLWVKLSKILDIPKERFACLYETSADNGDITVPPGVIAALNTFADALSMVKSNMWGGKNDDRDSDN